jgi:hypothetical protein
MKTIEKLVDRHIRDWTLKKFHLIRNLRAYQTNKPTDTALHNVTIRTETATEHKVIALEGSHDKEGTFDKTSFGTIKLAAEGHEIEPAIGRWMRSMLGGREIIRI